MIDIGKLFSIIGMGLEAYSLYLIYNRLPTYYQKLRDSVVSNGLPSYISDEDTKEGQKDILYLIGFSLLFQIIGVCLN